MSGKVRIKSREISCMVMDGKSFFGGNHALVYMEIWVECCIHETNIML